MATIKDVAEKAGVSIATVSRILNKHAVVSEKTVRKVEKAMQELDYYPDAFARAMQTGKSGMLGLIVPSVSYRFFSELTDAIEEACHNAGYRLMICRSDFEEQRELDMVSLLKANKVDGLMVCSYVGHEERYSSLSLPIISIDREMDSVPSVTCSNEAGGKMAAAELAEAGCRHPMLITGEVPEFMPLHRRHKGFMQECGARNLSCETFLADPQNPDTADRLVRCLKEHPETDGFFIDGDYLAVQLIRWMRNAGSDALGRLPVVGFDGLDVAELFDLTTIAQPIRLMGSYAVDLLIRRLNGEVVPVRTELGVTCVERDSTLKRKIKR